MDITLEGRLLQTSLRPQLRSVIGLTPTSHSHCVSPMLP
jgi:hypothetical protein